MPRTTFTSVDEYILSQPGQAQRALARVREVIRRTVPRAVEGISYSMPAYKLDGRPLVYFAGFTQHYSLFPASKRLAAALKKELAPYEYNGKGTIRFPLSAPVPARAIAAFTRFRAKEVQREIEKRRTRGRPAAKR